MSTTLRIATRKSPLALWQAGFVADNISAVHPGVSVELVKMVTQGDRILDAPLAKIGGKGLFVKELEQGLLEGRADIAVHSMKDVPAELPEGLHIPVILARAMPQDAFVSLRYQTLEALPPSARVGTSSLRRQCQIKSLRPDITLLPLRGNVGTRLDKLESGDFDAIILAAAGLTRLGLSDRITGILATHVSLPAVGQGAIGIECRRDDQRVEPLIQALHHEATARCIAAERAFNARLNGGCQVPIAGFAELSGEQLCLRGLVGSLDGQTLIRDERTGHADEAVAIGEMLAESLLAAGAGALLKALAF